MSTFSLKIISTDKVFYDGKCEYLVIPTIDGEKGILAHHENMVIAVEIGELADLLECTEKDILRALRYWKSEGLLDYLDDTPDDPSPKSTAPSPAASSGLHDVQSGYMTSSIPADSVSDSAALASTTNIQQYRSRKERAEFKELLFVAEQYL